VDKNTEGNKRTVQDVVKLGGKSREYACNVTDSKAVADLSKMAGPLDVLVNNPGIMYCGPLLETLEDSINRVIIVTVTNILW
jgi:NAD(P)-dependent dehydrogenase (short-subunit alcohol dehydrogenase family)